MLRQVERSLGDYFALHAAFDEAPRPANIAKELEELRVDVTALEAAITAAATDRAIELADHLLTVMDRLSQSSSSVLKEGAMLGPQEDRYPLPRDVYAAVELFGASAGEVQRPAADAECIDIQLARFRRGIDARVARLATVESRGRGPKNALRDLIRRLASIYDAYRDADTAVALSLGIEPPRTRVSDRREAPLLSTRLRVDFVRVALDGAGIAHPTGEELARLIPR